MLPTDCATTYLMSFYTRMSYCSELLFLLVPTAGYRYLFDTLRVMVRFN